MISLFDLIQGLPPGMYKINDLLLAHRIDQTVKKAIEDFEREISLFCWPG